MEPIDYSSVFLIPEGKDLVLVNHQKAKQPSYHRIAQKEHNYIVSDNTRQYYTIPSYLFTGGKKHCIINRFSQNEKNIVIDGKEYSVYLRVSVGEKIKFIYTIDTIYEIDDIQNNDTDNNSVNYEGDTCRTQTADDQTQKISHNETDDQTQTHNDTDDQTQISHISHNETDDQTQISHNETDNDTDDQTQKISHNERDNNSVDYEGDTGKTQTESDDLLQKKPSNPPKKKFNSILAYLRKLKTKKSTKKEDVIDKDHVIDYVINPLFTTRFETPNPILSHALGGKKLVKTKKHHRKLYNRRL